MDFIINFLAVNPYQAVAVPVLGGLAAGTPFEMYTNPGYFSNSRSKVQNWYPTLRKPRFNPPNWVFAPAWTALYVAMGYSSHLVARACVETLREPVYVLASHAVGVYAAQLGVNLGWMPLFFAGRNPQAALLDIGILGGMVVVMTWLFAGVDRMAGLLCVPYMCWICFATYLNYSIVKLNPQEGVDKAE